MQEGKTTTYAVVFFTVYSRKTVNLILKRSENTKTACVISDQPYSMIASIKLHSFYQSLDSTLLYALTSFV